ncbi:L-rhamnose/proton symporter RhaT [Persicitalea jodogahamensis]|uniref:Sugar:proton symporter n=1 Tax=Persicitalea jodogahamensis TaxID=402147 RepID=A0A8J3D4P1_9BACT|nr:L-rhamnose/proton symporter RhaT [Persicitalea jodogahamensis]GHB75047.1 sugar:proton symporter [Persicitalea jodogahamensis]
MIEGIVWAVFAGITLGLYALPEKFARGFAFENTWGLMFFLNMFVVPPIAALLLIDGFGNILSAIPTDILLKMAVASLLWGIGVMMWGKAINYIGLSLGFSIFIGTVILVGSLLPFLVDAAPDSKVLLTILLGILIVLVGVIANGRAGMLRQAGEAKTPETRSMGTGITIAVVGGLMATGFSYANAVGRPVIHELTQMQGNPEWVTAVAVMFVIYVAGGLFVIPYFLYQLSQKGLWDNYKTPFLTKNIGLTFLMALLNFVASAAFAFAAFKLGTAGNTVGYAIFNTVCVAVAIVSGLLTGEWAAASPGARRFLYVGLAAMITGVVVIALGNGLSMGT